MRSKVKPSPPTAGRRFIPVSERVSAPSVEPPPLPDPIPDTHDGVSRQGTADAMPTLGPLQPVNSSLLPIFQIRSLRHGCYLLRYTPTQVFPTVHYDGTLRVERHGAGTTASGDLYLHQLPLWGWPVPSTPEPNPGAGIPILPRSRYRYYLRVTQVLEWFTIGNGFTLGFEMRRFNHATGGFTNDGAFTVPLTWTTAPAGYPSGSDYLTGEVRNAAGAVVGTLTMGWVSPYLRKAVFEIDRVSVAEAPLSNGAGTGWKAIFDPVGWDVTVDVSDSNVAEPSGESWSDAELHAGMLARRKATNLDAEWRYHVLAVRRLDSTSRGIMYDAYGSDSNNIPREGCGISSHWMIPNTSVWGQVKGLRFGTATAPYFRTAVHEIGHALGLYHNTADNGIMNTTDVIAASATPTTPFPTNIQWSFAPDDQKRLRHMPDVWIRPGGVPFGSSYNTAPISPDDMIQDATGLELEVAPLLESVPIGAPVRINVALVNVSDRPLPVPASLSMKSGHVKGTVVDPAGTVRTFWPIVRCIEEHEMRMLAPGERLESSMTLLRGAEGSLFPVDGAHTVTVEVDWDLHEGGTMGIAGEATVQVTPAADRKHAAAAQRILSTPDALLTLVFGGDHLEEGVAAMQTGLQSEVLRPHFAVIEAKRLGERFGSRPAKLDDAARLLDGDAVMSPAELRSTAKIIGEARNRKATGYANAVQQLKVKVSNAGSDAVTRELVKKL
jgi:hypothetical protein